MSPDCEFIRNLYKVNIKNHKFSEHEIKFEANQNKNGSNRWADLDQHQNIAKSGNMQFLFFLSGDKQQACERTADETERWYNLAWPRDATPQPHFQGNITHAVRGTLYNPGSRYAQRGAVAANGSEGRHQMCA